MTDHHNDSGKNQGEKMVLIFFFFEIFVRHVKMSVCTCFIFILQRENIYPNELHAEIVFFLKSTS